MSTSAHDPVASHSTDALVALLERWIGLDAQTLGSAAIARAVRVRREACGEPDEGAFLARLARDTDEQGRLIDEVVVPESWFLRDPQVFAFLRRYATSIAIAPGQPPIRILCVPCAAGQEPYSVAITLFEVGLSPLQFQIEAADVSRAALEKAAVASYSANAFRGSNPAFRARWFEPRGTTAELIATVRNQVNFFWGNLLDESFAVDREPYDVVFCRNLLIYLTADARQRAEQAIERLLKPDGLVVLGAAEPPILKGSWIPASSDAVFTLRRGIRSSAGVPTGMKTGQPPPSLSRPRTEPDQAVAVAPSAGDSSTPSPYKTVDAEPSTVADLLVEAGGLANAGRRAEALAICRRHQQEVGPDSRVFFLMGMLHHAAGELEHAEACLHKTLYLDPNHGEALLALATLAADRGDSRMSNTYRQNAARIRARKEST